LNACPLFLFLFPSNNPWDPPAPVYSDSVEAPWGPKQLHHKYMILDSDFDSTAIIITGSQNWSNNGELRNDENTLIIHSAEIANQYLQEFAERYREAGGEYIGFDEEKKVAIHDKKIKIYPNPFYNSVRISGCPHAKVYDISGRFITEVKDSWNGRNYKGKEVNSGIYFLKCKRKKVKKIVKLR
jgi:phosphatidylserine/phosphatidylglycerophosphate/cardiolipin synthase-like enzyme